MRNIAYLHFLLLLAVMVLSVLLCVAQSLPSSAAESLRCTPVRSVAQNEPRTYLVGASHLSLAERNRIKNKWGTLTIPKGETRHAQQTRARANAYRQSLVVSLQESFEIWKKAHPTASPAAIEKRRTDGQAVIDYFTNNKENREFIAAPRWDWRDHRIDVGRVRNQGEGCNTCWAFAATDAAAASLQKSYLDGIVLRDYMLPDRTQGNLSMRLGPIITPRIVPRPFVQDLLDCMPIQRKAICNSGWHGNAFDFMVYQKGIPIQIENGMAAGLEATESRLYTPGQKFACQNTRTFIKGSVWDYVNSPPDQLPSVQLLKTALIEHGPLVAPIFYDECLAAYRGGIFNERDNGMVNHVVLLIGWDDTKNAWLVKNSWGEEWGEKGFGWIQYGSNNIGVFAAWIDARWDY